MANYVAPTLKMIQLADDSLGDDFLKDTIENTVLKESQKKMVLDYLYGKEEMENIESAIKESFN